MEWTPQPQDLEWTKNIIESMELNQDWMEGEMAFRRTGEKTLSLLTRTQRAEGPAERVKIVLEELEWTLDESQAKIIPDDPMLAAEMMQQQAESWTCPECNEQRVVNMPLENAMWKIEGQTYYVNEEGDREGLNRWVVGIDCQCGNEVHLSPDDYFLVAGELNFYTWIHPNRQMRFMVLSPELIVEAVDSETLEQMNTCHLGSTYHDAPVPPHMRGTFCLRKTVTEEEE